MDTLFSVLTEAMSGSIFLALLASFGWGIMSILLSPCHLSSIPLIIGYVSSQGAVSQRKSVWYSFLFAFGILITIAIVGVVTASMGRIIGDIGKVGNWIVAGVFLLIGLYLLDIISLPISGPTISNPRKSGMGALALGLIFGLGLGPCTFAYFAPILGVVFGMASKNWFVALALILAFGIGHCSIIVGAGSLSNVVTRYVKWFSDKKAGTLVQKTAGVLVILGGLYFIWTSL